MKVCHAVSHRNHYRSWMTKVAVVIPWISGVCSNFLPVSATTRVVQGRCMKFVAWGNDRLEQVRMAFVIKMSIYDQK